MRYRVTLLLIWARNLLIAHPVIRLVPGPLDNPRQFLLLHRPLVVQAGEFNAAVMNVRRTKVLLRDAERNVMMKLVHGPAVERLKRETQVLTALQHAGSASAPPLLDSGVLKHSELPIELLNMVGCVDCESEIYFSVTPYYAHTQEVRLADLILAVLEQVRSGVWCNDLKSSNVRFDPVGQRCVIVDLDNAVDIDPMRFSDAREVIDFAEASTHAQFGQRLEKALMGYRAWFLRKVMNEKKLNLGKTTLFGAQHSTRAKGGGYHRLAGNFLVVEGVRDLAGRRAILDQLPVAQDETVLDVGGNLGLASMYMSSRGATVTCIDIDEAIVALAKSTSIVEGNPIECACLDLATQSPERQFDTVLLFSVLHHTTNPRKVAVWVSTHSRRAILEVRLRESGKAFLNGQWQESAGWDFKSIDELQAGMRSLFCRVEHIKYLGEADKGRHMLLLTFETSEQNASELT